ncbi:MAG: hypothetical protein L3J12_09370 [Spirochaetales bacterium]|nr:hypothetical protein [Spirochaetales bacterium]
MVDIKTLEVNSAESLGSLLDLLKKRGAIFPWEAAFALKIKTTEALELLSQLEKQRKAEKFTVESRNKECTGMGCVGCDCTNTYIKKEIKYRGIQP